MEGSYKYKEWYQFLKVRVHSKGNIWRSKSLPIELVTWSEIFYFLTLS